MANFIDDDPEDHEIFDLAIEKLDGEIMLMTAINGVEAINLLLTGSPKPDNIFLDPNMPRMNGKQFLTAIKDHQHFSGIPVVIYSTSSYGR